MPMNLSMGLGLGAGRGLQPLWMDSMDMGWDFTNGNTYYNPPSITDTHGQTHYAQSASGVWSPFAANTLVRTDLGLQTVPTRTNSIRNNSMSGAVAGSPGTLPTNWTAFAQTGYNWNVAGTGSEFGFNYIDYRVSGTDASSRVSSLLFESTTGIVAATGETWTASSFARVVGGTLAGVTASIQIDENTSAGVYVTSGQQSITLSSTFTRFAFTRALSGGATVARVVPYLRLTFAAGATVDVTIRVYAPQMELGAFASAPILTTSGAATVNGNQQVVDLTGRLSAGVGLIMQFNPMDVTATFKQPISFNDGSSNNTVNVYMDTGGGTPLSQIITAGVNQGNVTMPGANAIGVQTWVIVAGPNYHRTQKIGSAAATADTTVTWPTMTRMAIGGTGYNAADNMYQLTRRLALRFGAANDAMFNDLVAKATLLAAVS